MGSELTFSYSNLPVRAGTLVGMCLTLSGLRASKHTVLEMSLVWPTYLHKLLEKSDIGPIYARNKCTCRRSSIVNSYFVFFFLNSIILSALRHQAANNYVL